MGLQKVPLSSAPFQTLALTPTIDGKPVTLTLTVVFNEMAGLWMLGIADVNNNPLVNSVPMVTGAFPGGNLLQQQRYLGIGSWYVVNVSNTSGNSGASSSAYGQGGYGQGPYGGSFAGGGVDYPGPNNLGTDFELWVGDTPTA